MGTHLVALLEYPKGFHPQAFVSSSFWASRQWLHLAPQVRPMMMGHYWVYWLVAASKTVHQTLI